MRLRLLPCAFPPRQRASQYIEDLIPTLRKFIQKAETPAKKKGAPVVREGAGGRGGGTVDVSQGEGATSGERGGRRVGKKDGERGGGGGRGEVEGRVDASREGKGAPLVRGEAGGAGAMW